MMRYEVKNCGFWLNMPAGEVGRGNNAYAVRGGRENPYE